MFLLGILSVLQITLIPGFILLHFLKIKTESPIQKYIYIFSFSLFINYSLVTILTLLKLYTITSLWIIIILELICILILIKTDKINLTSTLKFSFTPQNYFLSFKSIPPHIKIVIGLAGIIVLYYFALFISNLGTVFYFVDTVNLIHWNTWAKDFANNTLPRKSFHFPQLIPTNWSISYVLTGSTDINFFPKSFMPLFFLGNLLFFVDLAIWKRNIVYLIGLIIYGLFAIIIYPLVFIADGNADLPVSFFTFLTFYSYLRLNKNKFEIQERLIFFLFAATAAATKLAGIYVFLFASLISLYGLIKHWKEINRSKLILIFTMVPLIVAISFFWHLMKPEVMYSGINQPYVEKNYFIAFAKAAELIYYNWGLPVVAFFILTIIASLFKKNIRYLTLLMVIPPFILWMSKFSSDFRNLSFVIPFLSLASAYGLVIITEKVKHRPLNLNFEIIQSNKYSLSGKEKFIGTVISIFCVGLFFIINTDFFYNFLLQTHKFLSIHYFQSYRINLLVDYTQYISIDYYQNVLATFVLIIPALYLLSVINVRVYQAVIVVLIAVLILNFSYFNQNNIISHHNELVQQIDARNYASWMNSIVETISMDKQGYTNFKAISTENVPGELKFIYLERNALEKYLTCSNCKYLFFLKHDLLDKELEENIENKISQTGSEVLFDDKVYMLIFIQSD